MSRWHLSTSKTSHNLAKANCFSVGLQPSGNAQNDDFYLESYFKRIIKHDNHVQFENNDWICYAGTILINDKFGKDALIELYDLTKKQGIEVARSQLLGHFAIALKVGQKIRIFTDLQGSHTLYYAQPGEDFHATNSLHVLSCMLSTVEIDELNLISHVMHGETVGDDTFIKGVKRLYGSQIIEFTPSYKQVAIVHQKSEMYSLENPYNSTIEKCVDEYKELVLKYFRQITTIAPYAINCTGGLDTRTILAAISSIGGSPGLLYGVGNSKLTNTKPQDLDVARRISSHFGLPLYEMDWSGQHPHNPDTVRTLLEQYGFLSTFYGAPNEMLDEVNGRIRPYPHLQMGGYSPALTNMKLWEKGEGKYTSEKLLSHFAPLIKKMNKEWAERYTERTLYNISQAVKYSPVELEFKEGGTMSLEEFVRIRLFLYIRSESNPINFYNEFCYYLAPFMDKRLYDPLLTLPFDYRANDRFQIKLTKELKHDIFDIPLFSGGVWREINETDKASTQVEKSKFQTLKGMAKWMLPSDLVTKIQKKIHSGNKDTLKVLDQVSVDSEIRDYAVSELNNVGFGNVFETYQGLDVRFIYKLYQTAVGAHSLAKN